MPKQKLSKAERSAIAREAQKKRWAKVRVEKETPPHVTKEWTENYDPVCVPECPACEANGENAVAPGLSGEPINQEPYRPEPSSAPISVNGVAETINAASIPQIKPMGEPLDAPAMQQKHPRQKRKPMPKEFGKAHGYAEKRLAEAIKERAECMGKLAMLEAEIPSLVQIINALGGKAVVPVGPISNNYPVPAYVQPQAVQQAIRTPQLPSMPGAHGGAVDFGQQQGGEDQFLDPDKPGEVWH